MKKLTLLFILSLSLSFLYAKEITISVGAGQHWKEKREPQFSVWFEDKEYLIKAEFNTSFDYNDFYTKKNSGVNGQPSVICKRFTGRRSFYILCNFPINLIFLHLES